MYISVNSDLYRKAENHAGRHVAAFAKKGHAALFELLFLIYSPISAGYTLKIDLVSICCFVVSAHLPQCKERVHFSFLGGVYGGYNPCDDFICEVPEKCLLCPSYSRPQRVDPKRVLRKRLRHQA